MAGPKLFDRVKDTTTTTGTGTLTLANSAPTGFRTFGSVLSDADTCFYAIATSGGSEWEVGIGTYTSAGTTLARTTVLASSTGSAVSLSAGTKGVFIPAPALVQNHLYNPTGTTSALAAYMAGRVGFPTDSPSILRDTGSALVPWGPTWKLGDASSPSWSWVNQGSATITTAGTSQAIYAPSNAGGNNLRGRVMTAPATPYTFRALIALTGDWTTSGYCGSAVLFRESSSGKMVSIEFWSQTAGGTPFIFKVVKYTDASNISSTPVSANWYGYGIGPWVQLADDGTNRTIKIGPDGFNWPLTMITETRTTFMTADQVGFGINPFSQAGSMSVLDWLQG